MRQLSAAGAPRVPTPADLFCAALPRSGVIIATLVGLALALVPHPSLALAQWSVAEEASLARGEAVVRIVKQAGAGGRVIAAIDIPVEPRSVWGVMLDCERAPHYVPGLQSCAILDRAEDGLADLREHRIRWTGLLPELTLRFRSEYEPERRIRVMRVGGDLRAMQGEWVLEPRDGDRVTRLHYDFHIAPRVPMPAGLVRAAMLRDAPDVLEAVRTEALRVATQ